MSTTGRLLQDPAAAPASFAPLLGRVQELDAGALTRFAPPEDLSTRESAVLVLLADEPGRGGPDVLLTERAHTLRHHPGQPSFPGGAPLPNRKC